MQFIVYKNAVIFEIKEMPEAFTNVELLQEKLLQRAHQPILDNADRAVGFINPVFDTENEALFHKVDSFLHVAYQIDTRSVDEDTINIKIEKAREELLEKLSIVMTKEKENDLRDQYRNELLPFQKVNRKTLRGYVDIKRRLFVVDTKQVKQAEDLTHTLRTALGSFKTVPLLFEEKPCVQMARWIEEESVPANLQFDDAGKTIAKEPDDKDYKGTKVTYDGLNPVSDEHVSAVIRHMDVLSTDLWVGYRASTGFERLFFTVNSTPNTSKTRKPDLILSGLNISDSVTYYCESLNAGIFISCTHLGLIIDAVIPAFGGLESAKAKQEGDEKSALLTVYDFKRSLELATDALKEQSIIVHREMSPCIDANLEINSRGDDWDHGTDELFDQVRDFVAETRRASVSGIQRKFRIGYNRAARIVELLEVAHVISSPDSVGKREVLIAPQFDDSEA